MMKKIAWLSHFLWEKSNVLLFALVLINLFALPDILMEEIFSPQAGYESYQTFLGCLAVILVVAYAHNKAQKWGYVKWDRAFFTWKSLALILAAYGLMWLCDELGFMWLEALGKDNTANEALLAESMDKLPVVFNFFSIALLPAVVEEVIFRGLLQKRLFGKLKWLGFLVASVLFGLAHGPTDWPSFFIYTSSGFIFGYLYLKTDNLAYPMAVHFLNNFISVLLDYL